MDTKQKHELLLTQLVLMFQAAAMQQMGKLKNPFTDKVERDLSQAQISIDMLDMISVKMKGNLSPEEENILKRVLQDLRLNYVDEVARRDKEPPAAVDPTPEPKQPVTGSEQEKNEPPADVN